MRTGMPGELFNLLTGAGMVHVPYRGSAPTMTDLAAGQVDCVIDGVGVSRPLIEAGRLRALATARDRRLARYPDLPTLAELGIAGVLPGSWFGLAGPASLPGPVVQALSETVAAPRAGEDRLDQHGLERDRRR